MKPLLLLAFCALLKYTGAAVCYSGSSPIQCSDPSCGGSCTSDNGCICSDDITNCIPVGSECPMQDNTCCVNLEGLYWNNTLQCCQSTPECNPSCLQGEKCNTTNNEASCVCNHTMYSKIKISDLKPTVKCEGGTMIASVSRCELEALGYNYSSFHIINDDNNCTLLYSDIINHTRVESIQLKLKIGWCGNLVTKDTSKIYFTNTLHIDPFRGPLITKNPIVFNFSCEYSLTILASLNFSLNPVLSSVVIPSTGAEIGSFIVDMIAYSDADFTVPIQQDEEITVGSSIYLGLVSPSLDANIFTLRVEKCFATPTSNPNDPNGFAFVNGGCAVSTDVLSAVLENGNSSEARIQTNAFLFQGYIEVYIFCDVTICNKTNRCAGCNLGRSGNADFSQLGIKLNLQALDYSLSSGHHMAASWTMLAASLLGLLSVKVF